MNSDELKDIIARHFRYDKQCPFVAFEAGWDLDSFSRYNADVLAVNKEGFLLEAEVKVSLADLKKDAEKGKHGMVKDALRGYNPVHSFGNRPRVLTHLFYFAVPSDLANQAKPVIDSLYPYAGLIAPVNDSSKVMSYKTARVISNNKLTLHELYNMAMQQSGTLCRLAHDVIEARRVNAGKEFANKELREQLRLYQTVSGDKVEVMVPMGETCGGCPLLRERDNSTQCGYTREDLKADPNSWMFKKGKNCPKPFQGWDKILSKSKGDLE